MSEKRISGWNAPVKAASLSDAKELYEKAERPIEVPRKKAKPVKSANKAKVKPTKCKKPVRTASKKPVSKKKAK